MGNLDQELVADFGFFAIFRVEDKLGLDFDLDWLVLE